jgi:hypothetical protein
MQDNQLHHFEQLRSSFFAFSVTAVLSVAIRRTPSCQTTSKFFSPESQHRWLKQWVSNSSMPLLLHHMALALLFPQELQILEKRPMSEGQTTMLFLSPMRQAKSVEQASEQANGPEATRSLWLTQIMKISLWTASCDHNLLSNLPFAPAQKISRNPNMMP